VAHVALAGDEKCVHSFGKKAWKEETQLENTGLDWRIILKWMFRKYDVSSWTGFILLNIGSIVMNTVNNLQVP
jgi:hypothetical protein